MRQSENALSLFSPDFAETLTQVLGRSGWRLQEIETFTSCTTTPRQSLACLEYRPRSFAGWAGTNRGPCSCSKTSSSTHSAWKSNCNNVRSFRQLDCLAAGVKSHEVNTPLTGVSSSTQMLLGMLVRIPILSTPLLQKVRTHRPERATNIVNNLLNFFAYGNATANLLNSISLRVLDDTLQLLEPQLRRAR